MTNVRVSCVSWAIALLTIAAPSVSAQWQIGSVPSFSTGMYGTDTRTDVFYVPLTARGIFSAGDITVVVPYLCIHGNGLVTIVGGAPTVQAPTRGAQTTPTRGGDTTTTTPGRGSADSTRGTTGTSTAGTVAPATAAPDPVGTTSACGLGDIVVRGRYYLVDEHGAAPTIALRANLKVPTADADQFLGTGRPDEGIGVEVSRTFGAGVLAMADAGYTFVGDPDGANFQNSWWYDLGVGKNLAGGAVNLSVFFEEYAAIVPGFVNARDILAAVNVVSKSGWRVQISGEFGVSDGAPDHGFSFGASRRF